MAPSFQALAVVPFFNFGTRRRDTGGLDIWRLDPEVARPDLALPVAQPSMDAVPAANSSQAALFSGSYGRREGSVAWDGAAGAGALKGEDPFLPLQDLDGDELDFLEGVSPFVD